MKTVAFDVDGTLFETGKGIKECVKYALDKLGLPQIGEDKLSKFIGPSLYYSFTVTVGLSDELAQKAVSVYREIYYAVGIDEAGPYEGVPQMLEALYSSGYELAVASSKPLVMVNRLLNKFDLSKYFVRVCAPDGAAVSNDKSSLVRAAMGDTMGVMVGDTGYDIEGAHGAGVNAIGVTYGYGTSEALKNADYIAASPYEVQKIILGGDGIFVRKSQN